MDKENSLVRLYKKGYKKVYRTMHNIKRYIKRKIGLRTIKTTVAIFICIALSIFLRRDDFFYSVTAATLCLQKTTADTWKSSKHRMLGTLYGGFFGYIVLLIWPLICYSTATKLFIVPLITLIIILVCNKFKQSDAIGMAAVVFFCIALYPYTQEGALMYVLNRMIDTMIGILVALVVNRYKPHIETTKDAKHDNVEKQEKNKRKTINE